ncbi:MULTISPECIES: MarR family winged helix-turn-helix transcriptional regulator [unclassified Streptomyces]|uniref:MarR family winged helix-turn-helix transcriptional regulator n=1 Tax=unclassified Streptomyces TaxID=2593676 RepID=UPI00364FAFAA
MSTPSPAHTPDPLSGAASASASVSDEVIEIERALNRIVYLTGRVRQHDRLMALAGVSLDRAAVALLRQISDSEPLRPGELAARLAVEASHVTRQVQQLEKGGYVTRVPDPDDRRAQRIQLTPAGQDAIDRIRIASCRGMELALSHWSPEELRQLSTLFHRMVDDFLHTEGTLEGEDTSPRRA